MQSRVIIVVLLLVLDLAQALIIPSPLLHREESSSHRRRDERGPLLSCTAANNDGRYFPSSKPPYLAIITEPDACDSWERMEDTYEAIGSAVSTNQVDLVSIRLTKSDSAELFDRAVELTQRLVTLSKQDDFTFKIVCSSDWVQVALQARAHGIHVKEAHLSRIPEIRDSFPYPPLIGTSSHSVESALTSFKAYHPDYYFVGTCFPTTSHPEKSVQDLEGPTLPATVRRAIIEMEQKSPSSILICPPKVLAIGGINESNCNQPIAHGADGVAVIRAVLAAEKPAEAVSLLHSKMNNGVPTTN